MSINLETKDTEFEEIDEVMEVGDEEIDERGAKSIPRRKSKIFHSY